MRKKKYTRAPEVMPEGVFELTVEYRRMLDNQVKVSSAEDVYKFAKEFLYKGSEQYNEKFFVLFIDRANNIFSWKMVSEGGMSATVCDQRLIFQTALLCHASAIICVHNHPSGVVKPSEQDRKITSRLKASGELLEIQLLDHVIVTTTSFHSFADDGSI